MALELFSYWGGFLVNEPARVWRTGDFDPDDDLDPDERRKERGTICSDEQDVCEGEEVDEWDLDDVIFQSPEMAPWRPYNKVYAESVPGKKPSRKN